MKPLRNLFNRAIEKATARPAPVYTGPAVPLGYCSIKLISNLHRPEKFKAMLQNGYEDVININDIFQVAFTHDSLYERTEIAAVAEWLLQNYRSSITEDLTRTLITAVNGVRNPKWVEILLEHGADPNALVGDRNAFHQAARSACESVLETLLAHGADINARDKEGRTALQRTKSCAVTAALLIKLGADVHADNEYALRQAVFNGEAKVLDCLIRAGADIHVTHEGQTLLQIAEAGRKKHSLRRPCIFTDHTGKAHPDRNHAAATEGHKKTEEMLNGLLSTQAPETKKHPAP